MNPPLYIKKTDNGAWLELRKTGIGGSDAGAVIGVNPYRTPVDVWLEKTGKADGFQGNDATYWGNMLEELVAQEYATRTGMPVRNYNYTVRSGCLIANIDRLVQTEPHRPAYHEEVRTNKGLECKTAGDTWTDGLPAWYEAQVMHYMGLLPTVLSFDVAVLFLRPRKFQVYTVERDNEVIAELQRVEEEFWRKYVVGNEMPPPQSEADCKKLWARSRGVKIPVTPEAQNALRELAEIAKQKAAAEGREKELRAKVFAAFGEADTLVDEQGRTLATWKSSKDSAKTDWKAVAEEAGASEETIEKHTVSVPGSRVFLNKMKARKEGE